MGGDARWITWNGETWRLCALAAEYNLNPKTLSNRLDRGLPVQRALATGVATRAEAALRAHTPWRRDGRSD